MNFDFDLDVDDVLADELNNAFKKVLDEADCDLNDVRIDDFEVKLLTGDFDSFEIDPVELKKIMKTLEVYKTVVVKEGEVWIRSLDPSHISLLIKRMEKLDGLFKEEGVYTYNELSNIHWKTKDVVNIIKMKDKPEVWILLKDGEKVGLRFEKEGEEIKEPKVDLKANVRLLNRVLREFIRDVKAVEQDVADLYLEVEEDKLIMRNELDDKKVKYVIERSYMEIIEFHVTERQKARYNLSVIREFVEQYEDDTIIDLSFGTDLPLKLTAERKTSEYYPYEHIKEVLWLAPKIE